MFGVLERWTTISIVDRIASAIGDGGVDLL